MANSPVNIPFTTDGVEIAVKDNTALPANARGNLAVGLDPSNNTQFLNLSAAGDLKIDGSGVTQPVSAAALPLPTGAATSAKQPALGTAGTASADVITVQGISSMTALKVDGSAVTQPASIAALSLAQGSTTSGQTGPLVQAAVTTSAPSYTTAQTSPLSLNTSGALRVETVQRAASSSSVSNVSLTTASSTALSANANRLGAIIFNDGAPSVFLLFGSGVTSANYTVKIPPAGYYEIPFGYTGIVTAATESSTSTLRVTELT